MDDGFTTVGRGSLGTRDAAVGTRDDRTYSTHSRRTDGTRKPRGLSVSIRSGPTGTTIEFFAGHTHIFLIKFCSIFQSGRTRSSVTRVADRSWNEECAERGESLRGFR